MEVRYAIRDDTGTFEQCDSFEIALAMHDEGDEIWVCVGDMALRALPKAFNRVVLSGDAMIRSAVLGPRELIPLDDSTNPGPLGSDAPMLVIDHRNAEVWWSVPGQRTELYKETVR